MTDAYPNFPKEKWLQDIYLYAYTYTKTILALKGGAGSGNFGHDGRPGEVGGSAPSGESGGWQSKLDEWQKGNVEIAMQAPKTKPPEKLQKYIDNAYSLGEQAKQAGYTSTQDRALYYDEKFESSVMGFDKPEMVAFEAGLKGNEKPYWVNGWRYGLIPTSGSSMNFAEGRLESGISVMAIDNGMSTKDPSFEMFGGSRGNQDKIYISGFLNTNTTGGDGEPLLLWAKQTGNVP